MNCAETTAAKVDEVVMKMLKKLTPKQSHTFVKIWTFLTKQQSF